MKFTEKPLLKNLFDRKTTTGALGEDEAVRLLKKQGYKILERNYRIRGGEIDIIARDGDYICFVEVKLRKSNNYGSPAEYITHKKKEKLIKTAMLYSQRKHLEKYPMRFDAVVINAAASNNKLKVDYSEVIKNAFEL